ncbi:MAG: carboxynorspermidine decarboxylase, partial [Alloprevotella sp.]|nr:carboxynorspermidine decarboxylase [Alloprevotella sp.]
VKTTQFNGITLPDIRLLKQNGEVEVLRRFTYEDYRDLMD